MESLEAQQSPVAAPIPATQRIVAESNAQNEWTAWFEDAPEQTYGAEFAITAVDRLLRATPERVPEYYREFSLTFWTEGRRELP